jgi:predicted metal-dependent hydrolase
MNEIANGVALFNSARFWHAHEAWEEIWLRSSGEEKKFLQGLIQLAAAYHHVSRGTYSGAVRLFDAALQKLEPFPDDYFGIGRRDAVAAAVEHRGRIAVGSPVDASEYPRLAGPERLA